MSHRPSGLAFVLSLAACGVAPKGPATQAEPAPGPATTDAGSATTSAPPAAPDASIPIDAAAPPSALDATAPPAPPACPGAPAWAPGSETTIALSHGGLSRSYVVHVGTAVTKAAAPLVVNVHGLNNSPQIQELFSGLNAIADTEGFVVAYPQGVNASFNAGTCCGYAQQNQLDDLGFIRAIVADVEAKECIDARRVYATGFSNGGYMAHTLGCEASDLFAAIAPVSGAMATTSCNPVHPMPVIGFHGNADPIVAYADGQSAETEWAKRDGCTSGPARTAYGASYCDDWSDCQDGAAVRFCTIAGGSHLWPGAGGAIVASPMIWSFFTQHTLSPAVAAH